MIGRNESKATVSLNLELTPKKAGKASFTVKGVTSPNIILPPDSIVIPAVCLLGQKQSVTLGELQHRAKIS